MGGYELTKGWYVSPMGEVRQASLARMVAIWCWRRYPTSTALSQGESEAYVILVDIEAVMQYHAAEAAEVCAYIRSRPLPWCYGRTAISIMVQFITGNRGSILQPS